MNRRNPNNGRKPERTRVQYTRDGNAEPTWEQVIAREFDHRIETDEENPGEEWLTLAEGPASVTHWKTPAGEHRVIVELPTSAGKQLVANLPEEMAVMIGKALLQGVQS